MNLTILLNTLVYLGIGISIFLIFVYTLDKTTKWSLKKEIIEDENISLGIIIGCFFISIAIIIAAAIHG